MNKSRGFTIIELIVVIAIIAVLASIVLVNVTQYINKGKDAAIKGNYSTILTNAAVYYDTPANSGKFGTDYVGDTSFTNVEAAITSAGGTPVHFGAVASQNWCACSPEKVTSTTVYCVDNTGAKVEKASTTCAVECVTPATGTCVP